ncbi:MAG: protein phosphatase 2C domain-containing protein [Polyangiaceae bacterium]|nr:protein phosphatase 2C domain-containing protein [Polyangiaceae bacterium]
MMSQEALQLKSVGGTHVGMRRKNNQDSFLVDDSLGLWVVADGMGGRAAGEVASQQAVETVHEMVLAGLRRSREAGELASTLPSVAIARRILESAVQAATYMVFGLAEQDQAKSGMGTTLSAALRVKEGLLLAQVGDSRIYRVRGGEASQLTEDHTLINWQLAQGIITPEEAQRSRQKNVITRAVGNRDYVQVDLLPCDVVAGDKFLLCSDGLHGYLGQREVGEFVSQGGDGAVQAMIDLANDRGGKDNITVLIVEAAAAAAAGA